MDLDQDDYFSALVGRELVPRLGVALWIFDIDAARVIWANAAGLAVWGANRLDELASRDLGAEMSLVVRRRLAQYQEDFARQDAEFRETWTLYPKGVPHTLAVVFRGIRLQDGRMGMVCEAPETVRSTPEALRSAEAVLHTSVYISLIDLAGRVLYSNTAARACYGGSVVSLADRFIDPKAFPHLLEVVSVQGVFAEPVEARTLVGPRWHHVHASGCFDAVTGEHAILVSENDVSEAHEAREALLESRNAAIEASRLKTEFVANMSHEIRTPLNGVLGVTQLLELTGLTADQQELLQTLRSSGEALMAIIQDILDISRIESGHFDLHETSFTVGALLRELAETLFGTAVARDVVVHIDNQVPDTCTFRGDAKRIKQVLINLVGNAVKFSTGTPVTVRAQRLGDAELEFIVIDFGPGISKADQHVIFDRFRQADGSIRRQHGGTGLGLAISKSLVEKMGGSIGLESRLGAGATFRFRVPAPQVSRSTPLERDRADPAEAAPVANLRVLLADDNDTNRFIVQRLCQSSGMTVVVAKNGVEALARLQEQTFDIVLMDVHMPVLSGPEAITRIRASDADFCDVPIIVLSADAMEISMRGVMEQGADDYLTKPIDAAALIALIGRLAAQRGHLALGPRPRRRVGRASEV